MATQIVSQCVDAAAILAATTKRVWRLGARSVGIFLLVIRPAEGGFLFTNLAP